MRSRHVLSLAVPAGKPATGKWAPRNDAHPILLRRRQHVGLDAAYQDRIRRLLGHKPTQSTSFRHPLRLDDFVRGVGRRAEDSDLALPLQVGQRSKRLLDVGSWVWTMNLIQVDPIG